MTAQAKASKVLDLLALGVSVCEEMGFRWGERTVFEREGIVAHSAVVETNLGEILVDPELVRFGDSDIPFLAFEMCVNVSKHKFTVVTVGYSQMGHLDIDLAEKLHCKPLLFSDSVGPHDGSFRLFLHVPVPLWLVVKGEAAPNLDAFTSLKGVVKNSINLIIADARNIKNWKRER